MPVTRAELDKFFSSDSVSWLIASARDNRALKIAFPKEVNISNLFAWLFDSNEGHGLGDLALRTLLLKAWEAAEETVKPNRVPIRPTEVHKVSFSNAVVLREFDPRNSSGAKNRLDIVIVDQSNKLLIGIENKYGAKQGPEQLKRYADALTKMHAKKPGWRLVLALLDYDTESQPADTRWVKLDYGWISTLVNAQLERGLLSADSAATLTQFVKHLDDEGLAPYPRLAEAKATSTILNVAHDHPNVIAEMRSFRNKFDIVASVTELLTPEYGALALEYIRHRALWDHVLDTGKKAELLVPLAKRFPDIDSDLGSSRCRSFFIRAHWTTHSASEAGSWPLYVALYQSERRADAPIRVTADLHLSLVETAHRKAYEQQALSLRKANKLALRGLRKDSDRIRVAYFEFQSLEKALAKLIELIEAIDETFFSAAKTSRIKQ